MKVKTGLCADCADDIERPIIAGRCQYHYWKYRAGLKPKRTLKKQKPIPNVSGKQLKRLEEYRKVRNEFMKSHPTCEARLKGCTIKATDLHHLKGRLGDFLTDKKYFKALCRNCHNFIEVHPNFAKENGFSANRLTTNI